tara:strand:+ start:1488 stop:2108 length:621 start_codon:yes stop_codon:yes gene_type:complete
MAISTYDELKASIASWLNRDDLTAVIPDFISLAEASINRDLRHYKMVQRSDATLDSRYIQTPEDWLETLRFSITSGTTFRIEPTSTDDLIQLRAAANNESGRPRFYANAGNELEVFPTPDTEYTMQLMYYGKTPELSVTNTYNWLLRDAPDAYLYGSLVQSAPYLNDDARTQVWASLYSTAMQSLQKSSDENRFARSGLRMRASGY